MLGHSLALNIVIHTNRRKHVFSERFLQMVSTQMETYYISPLNRQLKHHKICINGKVDSRVCFWCEANIIRVCLVQNLILF